MKKILKTKLTLDKTTVALLNDTAMGILKGGIRISDDTSWPSNNCPPTKASFTCPKL